MTLDVLGDPSKHFSRGDLSAVGRWSPMQVDQDVSASFNYGPKLVQVEEGDPIIDNLRLISEELSAPNPVPTQPRLQLQ